MPQKPDDNKQVTSEDSDPGTGDTGYRPSFEEVLVAAKGDDGQAFEQLFLQLNRRVYAFLRIRGARDPEGMVNDVFLKIFGNIDRFDGNEIQFRAWVFTIARHQLVDEGRKSARRVLEIPLEGVSVSAAGIGDAESDSLAILGNGWVAEQLASLTPDQREVVTLRIVGDLTIGAIAEIMEKQVGAVKALQRRAFRTLARNIDREAAPL